MRLVVTFLSIVVLGAATLSAQATASAQDTSAPAVRPGPGLTNPRVVTMVEPKYPGGAADQREGVVELEVIVGVSGKVTAARVVKGMSPSFDAAAVEAANQWRFLPGRDAAGNPVPFIISLILEFRHDQTREQADAEFTAAYRPGNGISNPVLVRQQEPQYTAAARAAGVQGVVELDAVVRTDGTVRSVRVIKSLDGIYGLDDQAIRAARLWVFKPATDRNGVAVPVIVRLILEFRQ